jgi:hypothetical protein
MRRPDEPALARFTEPPKLEERVRATFCGSIGVALKPTKSAGKTVRAAPQVRECLLRRQERVARWGVPKRHAIPAVAVAIAAVFVVFELTLAAIGPYGYFVDEFYYLACAKRLAWGYVDHPPLAIGVLAATRATLGTSALAIRAPAALAVGGAVVLAAYLARRLGGGPYAQGLAALCTATSSMALVMASFYSMNAFELLFWPGFALALVVAAQRDPRRGWLAAGVVLGLGLENKHTMVLPAIAFGLGVLATPQRAQLRTRWPWIALATAALLVLPNILWQRAHGWASLEFYRNAQASKNIHTPLVAGIINQILLAGPGACVVWIAGVVWLFKADSAKDIRFLGVAFGVLFGLQIASGSSRPDRIGAIYPVMFAAGAVAIEQYRRRGWPWARVGAPLLAGLGAAVVVPITLPLLPPNSAARLAEESGLFPPIEQGAGTALPQLLADRTGWEGLVAAVDSVYRTLPQSERDGAVVLCRNYGCAGAIELLGTTARLPRAIAPHNSYWMWGPGEPAPQVVLAIGIEDETLDGLFASHELAGVYRCQYCRIAGSGARVVIGREPLVPLETAWKGLKHYN